MVIAQLEEQEKREKRLLCDGAKLPPMILEPLRSLTPSWNPSNGFIADPQAEEKERKRKTNWNDREKAIFFERFLQHPKNFKKISNYLDFKTEGDCVSYYYTNKHTLDLKRKLRVHLSKRGRGIMTQVKGGPPPKSTSAPPKPVDPNEFVVNEHRPGMRARAQLLVQGVRPERLRDGRGQGGGVRRRAGHREAGAAAGAGTATLH